VKGDFRAIAMVLVLALSAAGCAVSKPAPVPLLNASWVLQSYGDATAPTQVLSGTEITASFAPDGKVSGSAGCNRYSGEFKLDGQRVSISKLASTQMYCPEPGGIMTQESDFLGAMEQATSYEVKGSGLRILFNDGNQALTFLAIAQ
jgi:heat shock protein HslJ